MNCKNVAVLEYVLVHLIKEECYDFFSSNVFHFHICCAQYSEQFEAMHNSQATKRLKFLLPNMGS